MPESAALITGGTSGIGLATGALLHRRGFRVMITGRTAQSVAAAAERLPDDVVVVQADSSSLGDTDRVVALARERFGSLSAVFLNAGITRAMPIETMDETTYDEVFAVNTKGQFFTLQKALPLLTDGGSIVFTVGIGATRGVPNNAVTSGSRGALLTMIPALALELAPRRIRVNAVSPGPIDTPIWNRSGASADDVASMLRTVAAGVPFGRLGTADEIAETVAFLMSDGAAFITGQNLVVAGGMGIAA